MAVVKPSPASRQEARVGTVARTALKTSGYRAVALLDCEVIDVVVILLGVAPSFYLKQIAQAVILRLGTVERVENRVEVRLP